MQYMSPDLLDFDYTNPRFGGLMKQTGQAAMQKQLMGEPYFASELIDSLLANGFIDYEPLVVRKRKDRFVVVEGNRRLAAIQEIQAHPEKYKGRTDDLKEIPVLVFPDQPDAQQENEMRVYLGVRHLFGFREWPPLSKAQFLERESKKAGSIEPVLRETRLTKAQARRFLVPYRLLTKAKLEIPKGEDFWVLGEALQRAGIKKFVQLEVDADELQIVGYNKKTLGLLLNDLYGPKKAGGGRNTALKVVNDTRGLSRLSRVLGSEKATIALHGGKSLEEAEIYVDTREEGIKRLHKATRELGLVVKRLVPGRKDAENRRLLDTFKQFESAATTFIAKEP